jgi:hypothetical protein
MKPCNITYRSLIIAWLSESNKTTPIFTVCSISYLRVLKISNEKNAFMLQSIDILTQNLISYSIILCQIKNVAIREYYIKWILVYSIIGG